MQLFYKSTELKIYFHPKHAYFNNITNNYNLFNQTFKCLLIDSQLIHTICSKSDIKYCNNCT